MKRKTLTISLIRDGYHIETVREYDFKEGYTYILDIPRIDLRSWKDAGIKVTVPEKEGDL